MKRERRGSERRGGGVVGFFALRVFVLFCFVFPLKVHYTVRYRPVLYGASS